jgi:hypothetical protein
MQSRKLIGLAVLAVALLRALGNSQVQTFTIPATRYSDRISFVVQDLEVEELEVEVFSLAGQKLFDSNRIQGQALDWRMLDFQSRPLASGKRCRTGPGSSTEIVRYVWGST